MAADAPEANGPRPGPFGPGQGHPGEAEDRRLAAERGWTVKQDGTHWRRVVPSPRPQRVVAGFLAVGAAMR
ncbi:hypothetical protein ACWGI0_00480 [Streptomyces sp. NPDC054802]